LLRGDWFVDNQTVLVLGIITCAFSDLRADLLLELLDVNWHVKIDKMCGPPRRAAANGRNVAIN